MARLKAGLGGQVLAGVRLDPAVAALPPTLFAYTSLTYEENIILIRCLSV
jgi:hypothetical protein